MKDHLRGVYAGLLAALAEVVREARAMGEIAATEDVDQVTFDLDALLLAANFAYVFFGDPVALERRGAASGHGSNARGTGTRRQAGDHAAACRRPGTARPDGAARRRSGTPFRSPHRCVP